MISPHDAAFAFRASLTLDRSIVGALGFLAFLALHRGPRWLVPAAGLAGAAAVFAAGEASLHATTSIPATFLTIAIAGFLALVVAAWPAEHGVLTRATLACAVIAGCLSITNFLVFHDWQWAGAPNSKEGRFGAIHYHDMFHYYLGAKYFPELGYDGLYACAAVAAVEKNLTAPRAPARDLRTNATVTVGALLRQSADCHRRFSDARWQAFAADVVTFFSAVGQRARVRFLTDFGYNATPFLTALHRPLVAWTTPTPFVLGCLGSIDAVLFVLCIALLAWAFGPAAAAFSALSWGVGVMWVFDHVGLPGSLGRLWWITSLVAAVSFARRGWFRAAGAGLGAAAALRAFPGAFLIWPAGVAVWHYLRRRSIPQDVRQLLIGAFLTLVVLGAASTIGVDPWRAYAGFLRNSAKHEASALWNFMGLAVLLGSEGRSSPAWWVIAIGLATLTVVACRRVELSAALAFSGIVAVFILFSVTNYDYVMLLLLAPFAFSRPGNPDRSDTLAFAACVLVGNVVFLIAPGADLFTYTVDSMVVILTLCFFSMQWIRRDQAVLRTASSAPRSEIPRATRAKFRL